MLLCPQGIASLQISDYAVTVFGGIKQSMGHCYLPLGVPQLLRISGFHYAADTLASSGSQITEISELLPVERWSLNYSLA
jgi:hypothetical protein